MSTYVRKITLDSCGAKPDRNHVPAVLLRVKARVNSYSWDTSSFGDFIRFVGTFKAIRPDGAQFVSRNMILPKVSEEYIMLGLPDALERKKLSKEEKQTAREHAEELKKNEVLDADWVFGFDIIANPDPNPNSARGYIYQTEFWAEPTQKFDPLVALDSVMPDFPSLNAPPQSMAEVSEELATEPMPGDTIVEVDTAASDTRDAGNVKGKKKHRA